MSRKEAAYFARQHAKKNIGLIAAVAESVRINDDFAAHITVTIGGRRVEWWPGSGKWSTGAKGLKADQSGDFNDFLNWLQDQSYGPPEEDFQVIE